MQFLFKVPRKLQFILQVSLSERISYLFPEDIFSRAITIFSYNTNNKELT